MGMIYQRGSIYWIKYYKNGKPYRESVKSDKEADAKRLLKKREGEISQGKLPGIYFDKVLFDELAEDYLLDYRINGNKSIARALNYVNQLQAEFEGARVPDITTPRIKAYIEKRMTMEWKYKCDDCNKVFRPRKDNKCPVCKSDKLTKKSIERGSINRELSALKRMLNLGAKQTPPKVDKVPYIPMLRENNIRKGFIEHQDFIALHALLPDYLKGFVSFAYRVGWRFSEITGLQWDQVDLDEGIVRIEPGESKNDEARIIYLDKELKDIFKSQMELKEKTEEGIKDGSDKKVKYVFPGRECIEKITTIRKAWRTACKDAGIEGKLFHDFRRTAARNLTRSGTQETVAMKILGHRTRSIFDRYNISSQNDIREAAMRQEVYFHEQDEKIKIPAPQKLLQFFCFVELVKMNFLTGTVSGTMPKIAIKKGLNNFQKLSITP
jgi:integrase